ncbi:MAG: zinc-ribbon domain-containing protein [Alphaproteobacteria bacterium]|nr:zinc-ribbon domain-containing protein [Alphaproteobacteria bacterium]
MIISCSKCNTKYKVKQGTLRNDGRKVKCSKCHHVWIQRSVKTEHKKKKSVNNIDFSRRLPVVIEYVVPKWFKMLPIALSILIVLTATFVFQDSLMSHSSFAKKMYQKIGMNLTDNLELGNVEIIRKAGNKFDINGLIVNKSQESKKVPNIIVRAISEKNVVKSFLINSPKSKFSSGDKRPFFKRVEDLPEDTKLVTLEIEDKIDRFHIRG